MSTCLNQMHPGFGGDEDDCPTCLRVLASAPGPEPVRETGLLADFAWALLYAVKALFRKLWANAFTLAWVFALTAFGTYWLTWTIFAVLDRTHP